MHPGREEKNNKLKTTFIHPFFLCVLSWLSSFPGFPAFQAFQLFFWLFISRRLSSSSLPQLVLDFGPGYVYI